MSGRVVEPFDVPGAEVVEFSVLTQLIDSGVAAKS